MAGAGEIATIAHDAESPVDLCLSRSREIIETIINGETQSSDVVTWNSSIDMSEIMVADDIAEAKAGIRRLDWPWPKLTAISPRIMPGILVGLAAEPKVGKTAFCEQAAEWWAQQGFSVLFFHLELSTKIVLYRRMARWSGIPVTDLLMGKENNATLGASDKLSRWPGKIHYVAASGYTVDRIISTAHKFMNVYHVDAVVVDYFQKIHGDGENQTQRMDNDLEELKTFAERAGVPVLLPAQYNAIGKAERVKTESNVRGTSALADKCNLFITLDRKRNETVKGGDQGGRVYESDRETVTTVRVVNNTLGPTGMFKLEYIGSRLMFQ